jgi:hypothetical protein
MIVDTPVDRAAVLPLHRLHLMRAAYLLMGVGLAVVKWPLLAAADTLPTYERVVPWSSSSSP